MDHLMPAGQDKLDFDENNIPHLYRSDVIYRCDITYAYI